MKACFVFVAGCWSPLFFCFVSASVKLPDDLLGTETSLLLCTREGAIVFNQAVIFLLISHVALNLQEGKALVMGHLY